MRYFLLLSFFLTIRFSGTAQSVTQKFVQNNVNSGEGSIMLNNDMELKGTIHFNFRTELVSFETTKKSRIYNSLNIMGFEYYDAGQARQRIFYSLPYEDPRLLEDSVDEEEMEHFFEVVHQYKKYSVISRSEFLASRQRRKVSSYSKTGAASQPVSTEIEKIFFLQGNDKISPYLEIITLEGGKGVENAPLYKTKVVDNAILNNILGDKYAEITTWAQANGLDFRIKKDLLQILDYHESLVAAR